MKRIVLEAVVDAYSVDDVKNQITVGDLIAFLEQFDDTDEVVLSFDNGYTYGGISDYADVYKPAEGDWIKNEASVYIYD